MHNIGTQLRMLSSHPTAEEEKGAHLYKVVKSPALWEIKQNIFNSTSTDQDPRQLMHTSKVNIYGRQQSVHITDSLDKLECVPSNHEHNLKPQQNISPK